MASSISRPTGSEPLGKLLDHLKFLDVCISRAHSLITALKLAATADDYQNPKIYWPDLLDELGGTLPDAEEITEYADAMFRLIFKMPAGTLKASRAEVDRQHEYIYSLAKYVGRTQSMIEAFKLGHRADKHQRPEIDWSDLMETLGSALPEAGDLAACVDIAMGMTAQSVAPALES